MKLCFLLFLALTIVCSPLTLRAQGGYPGPGDIHRSLNALESELMSLLDRKEQILAATEKRNNDLHDLSLSRAKADGQERDRLARQIEALNNQGRAAAVEQGRLDLTADRIRLAIDRLMRFDDHASSNGKGGNHAPPPIRSINVVKTERKGPMRVTGQGVGFQDTTIYEVIFADGARQRVESTNFVPQRN